jgi:hypothetical protein
MTKGKFVHACIANSFIEGNISDITLLRTGLVWTLYALCNKIYYMQSDLEFEECLIFVLHDA